MSGGFASTRHHEPEQHRGKRDPDLDAGQRDPEETEKTPECHHHGEGYGQQPHGGWAQLRTPQADRDHGQHVVEPGDRVTQSGQEPLRLALLDVREGRQGACKEHQQGQQCLACMQ